MKTFSKILAATTLAATLMTPIAANAACNNAGTSCSGKITRLYINAGGTLYLRLGGTDIPASTTCTASSNYGTLAPTNAAFKNFYAMALTAQASGATTTLRMVDNSPTCEIQYITLDTPEE